MIINKNLFSDDDSSDSDSASEKDTSRSQGQQQKSYDPKTDLKLHIQQPKVALEKFIDKKFAVSTPGINSMCLISFFLSPLSFILENSLTTHVTQSGLSGAGELHVYNPLDQGSISA